jgi:MSHA biogenesis protein MshI
MRLSFFRQRATELAVVNLYADRVEVGQIRLSGAERPVVALFGHFPSANHADTLQKVRRDLRLQQFRCGTLLPARQYQLQLLDAPAGVPEAEIKSAIRWRLKDYLDYPVESATLDVLALPADKSTANRGQPVYAISARNQDIEARMRLFAAAKIPLSIIDVAEMAQRNLATMFETDHRAIAMLSFSDVVNGSAIPNVTRRRWCRGAWAPGGRRPAPGAG